MGFEDLNKHRRALEERSRQLVWEEMPEAARQADEANAKYARLKEELAEVGKRTSDLHAMEMALNELRREFARDKSAQLFKQVERASSRAAKRATSRTRK